jgi:aminopeptidase-like protein
MHAGLATLPASQATESVPVTPPSDDREATLGRMLALIHAHWNLNRTAVNPDTDKLVAAIQRRLECRVREFPAGQNILTWVVPRHWQVRAAWIARLDGTRVVDYADCPLHVWTHSIPYRGVVSRAELEPHLYHDPQHPAQVPYHFVNGYRYNESPSEWGFCLSTAQHAQLTDDRYEVCIDADLDLDGTMKVVDHHLRGAWPETIFFAAHTCHPGMITDGLSNVALLVELFDRLARRPQRRYSYRLVLGPEYFAAAALLSVMPAAERAQQLGGLYLDMIGNRQTFGVAWSYTGHSRLDHVLANVMRHHAGGHHEAGHRKLSCNDEMFYDGPGFQIPTVHLGSLRHPEYHSNADNPALLDTGQLLHALELLERVIDVFETDFVPVRRYQGPLYLSRFGLYISPKQNWAMYELQERAQVLMDGRRSCFDIAHELGADFERVRAFALALAERELIDIAGGGLARPPEPTRFRAEP